MCQLVAREIIPRRPPHSKCRPWRQAGLARHGGEVLQRVAVAVPVAEEVPVCLRRPADAILWIAGVNVGVPREANLWIVLGFHPDTYLHA